MSIPSISSYFPSFPYWKYDVFLSFRGKDTRKNFTDHLSTALHNRGIKVFRDDKKLERGKPISSELFKAIEESRFSIIIFSRNYASSSWCLDELVQIVQCKNTVGQKVIPVFYDVDTSVVREQTGNYQTAFAEHEKTFAENLERVQTWRQALTEVANLSGFHLNNGHESEFIQNIVKQISSQLGPSQPMKNLKDLIGIKSRLKELSMLIGVGFDDVRMIGICGMGGIGKTTIARTFYDMFSYQFEGASFLADVREISEKVGLTTLQKQLLSDIEIGIDSNICNVYDGINMITRNLENKKVLIIVDDVTHVDQLERLVGKHDWFGLGSRIIITTRNKHLLKAHRVDQVYEARGLTYYEACQILNTKAFGHEPSKEYKDSFEYVVKYASGVPLALKVMGSFLFGKTVDQWRSALERLKKNSHKDILNMLQISFNGLEETEKKIFLDIACFFQGEQRYYVERILDGCGFDAIIGITTLVDKSLLTILEDNRLWMHDLLREFGKQIVYGESSDKPEKRSRLWKKEDVQDVLGKNTGTEAIEGIVLEEELNLSANAQAFSKMINLRLLKLHNVQLFEGIEYLSNELRLLHWHGYSFKSLPPNLQLDKTIEFEMCYSYIEQLWDGILTSETLKYINLKGCQNLYKTPDLTKVPNLEKLILEGCTRLHDIHSSLLLHKNITFLDMRDCTNLTALPSKIDMESLEEFWLSGCSKLKNFPEIVGKMEKLKKLYLNDCKSLVSLPSTLNNLGSLETLDLSGCSNNVESLEELDIRGTAVRQPESSFSFSIENFKRKFCQRCKGPSSTTWYLRLLAKMMPRSSDSMVLALPSSLSGLRSLTYLNLSGCYLGEGAIPSDIGDLCSLKRLNLSKNNFVSLPPSLSRLSKVYDLFLEDCKNLQYLPEIPPHTELLIVSGCVSLETSPNALTLCNLDSKLVCVFGVNCSKLLGCSNAAFLALKDYLTSALTLARSSSLPLSSLSFPKEVFHIIVPGCEIPEWCHQSEGSSIKIKRHPHIYNNSKLIGYVVCCVFVVNKHPPLATYLRHFTHGLAFYISSIDKEVYSQNVPGYNFDEISGQATSEHTWLIFLSRHDYISRKCKEIYNPVKIKIDCQGPGLEVKRCGARPIYEQDVEDQLSQSSDSTVWNLNKFPEDFDDAISVVENQFNQSIGFTVWNFNKFLKDFDDATSDLSIDDYDWVESSGSEFSDDEFDQYFPGSMMDVLTTTERSLANCNDAEPTGNGSSDDEPHSLKDLKNRNKGKVDSNLGALRTVAKRPFSNK